MKLSALLFSLVIVFIVLTIVFYKSHPAIAYTLAVAAFLLTFWAESSIKKDR